MRLIVVKTGYGLLHVRLSDTMEADGMQAVVSHLPTEGEEAVVIDTAWFAHSSEDRFPYYALSDLLLSPALDKLREKYGEPTAGVVTEVVSDEILEPTLSELICEAGERMAGIGYEPEYEAEDEEPVNEFAGFDPQDPKLKEFDHWYDEASTPV